MSSGWSDWYHACPKSTPCCFCQRRHAILLAFGRAFWRLPRLRLRVGDVDLLHSAAGVAQYTVGGACLHASTPTCAAQRQRRSCGTLVKRRFGACSACGYLQNRGTPRTVQQARPTAVRAHLLCMDGHQVSLVGLLFFLVLSLDAGALRLHVPATPATHVGRTAPLPIAAVVAPSDFLARLAVRGLALHERQPLSKPFSVVN